MELVIQPVPCQNEAVYADQISGFLLSLSRLPLNIYFSFHDYLTRDLTLCLITESMTESIENVL